MAFSQPSTKIMCLSLPTLRSSTRAADPRSVGVTSITSPTSLAPVARASIFKSSLLTRRAARIPILGQVVLGSDADALLAEDHIGSGRRNGIDLSFDDLLFALFETN